VNPLLKELEDARAAGFIPPAPPPTPSEGRVNPLQQELAAARAQGIIPPAAEAQGAAPEPERDLMEKSLRAAQMPARGMAIGTGAMMQLPEMLQGAVVPDSQKAEYEAAMKYHPATYAQKLLSQGGQWLMDKGREFFVEPETPLERGLETAGEWGLAPAAGASKPLKSAVNLVTLGSAGAAAVSKETARQLGAGETGQTVAEVAAGLLVALSPTKAGQLKFPEGMSKEHRRALTHLLANASNKEEALTAYVDAVNRGDTGTIGQLMRDQGVFNAESVVETASQGDRFTAPINAQRTASGEQIADEIRGGGAVGSGMADPNVTVERLQQAGGERLARNVAAADAAEANMKATAQVNAQAARDQAAADLLAAEQQAATSAQAAGQAEVPIASAPSTSDASTAFRQTLEEQTEAYKAANVRPYWTTAKSGDAIDSAPFKQAMDERLKTTVPDKRVSKFAKDLLDKEYGDLLSALDEPKVLPSDIVAITSEIGKRHEAKRVAGNLGAQDILAKDLQKIIQEEAGSGLVLGYDVALEKSREYYDKFGGVDFLRAMKQGQPETAINRAGGWAQENGAKLARQIVESGDADVISAGATSLRANIANNLNLSPDTLSGRYGQALEWFPSLKSDVEAWQTAKMLRDMDKAGADAVRKAGEKTVRGVDSELKAAEDAITAKRGVLSKGREKEISEFLNSPAATMDKLLGDMGNRASRERLTRLAKYSSTSGAGLPFRQLMRQRVLELVDAGVTNANRTGSTRFGVKGGTPVDQVFRQLVPALKNAGVLDDASIKAIEGALRRGDSNAQLQAALKKMKRSDLIESTDNLIASGLAVTLSPFLGSKQSLMVNGAIRRFIRDKIYEGRASDEQMQAYVDVIADHKRFSQTIMDVLGQLGEVGTKQRADEVAEIAFNRVLTAPVKATSQVVNEEE
jgi:hypothetical protein